MHLKPHLVLNVSAKSRLNNKVEYLIDLVKCQLQNQCDETVLIFNCSQEQALDSLRSVKIPTLSMGFVVDLELMIEDKALRLVANTTFFGIGIAVIGIFDKDPVLPRLPDKFMMFKGHYTLREFYFKDDQMPANPKHLFCISTGDHGQSSELELISETALASLNAKKQEVSFATIHDNFHWLLLDHESGDLKNEKPAKRPREGDGPDQGTGDQE